MDDGEKGIGKAINVAQVIDNISAQPPRQELTLQFIDEYASSENLSRQSVNESFAEFRVFDTFDEDYIPV